MQRFFLFLQPLQILMPFSCSQGSILLIVFHLNSDLEFLTYSTMRPKLLEAVSKVSNEENGLNIGMGFQGGPLQTWYSGLLRKIF